MPLNETNTQVLLEVKGLIKHFIAREGWLSRKRLPIKAVDGVTFAIRGGETFGLVGESGCGKSTLGRTVLRLLEATEGEVFFEGTDILSISHSDMIARRKDMQMIFQDPFGSLNPRLTVGETILEPLEVHQVGRADERLNRVKELLELVGLRQTLLNRYPHEFSGGQRQRVGIARALASEPKFIVADEPVSSLDVSIQSQVLNLISHLQKNLKLTFLFISHDLAVIQHVSHRVGVMYLGKIVEQASVKSLFRMPRHPYTQAILSAVPVTDPQKAGKRIVLPGDVPSVISPPPGCPFHPRCPQAMPICRQIVPSKIQLGEKEEEHWVQCHLYTTVNP